MGVHGDGCSGVAVGPGHRPHDPGDPVGHALVVDGALEERGLDPRARDALGDVADEHVHHRIGHLGAQRGRQGRAPVEEEERHLVVGVATGGGNDVQLRNLLGDPLNAGYVAAEAHDGGVCDAPDPLGGEGLELADGVGDAVVLTPPLGRVVLLHVGVQDEDVLVHVGRPEVGGVDRTPDGLNGCHIPHSFRSAAETLLVSDGDAPEGRTISRIGDGRSWFRLRGRHSWGRRHSRLRVRPGR